MQQELFPKYGFTALPQEKIQVALTELEKLKLAPGVSEWVVERETQPKIGQGQYVISTKREGWVDGEVMNDPTMGVMFQRDACASFLMIDCCVFRSARRCD